MLQEYVIKKAEEFEDESSNVHYKILFQSLHNGAQSELKISREKLLKELNTASIECANDLLNLKTLVDDDESLPPFNKPGTHGRYQLRLLKLQRY